MFKKRNRLSLLILGVLAGWSGAQAEWTELKYAIPPGFEISSEDIFLVRGGGWAIAHARTATKKKGIKPYLFKLDQKKKQKNKKKKQKNGLNKKK